MNTCVALYGKYSSKYRKNNYFSHYVNCDIIKILIDGDYEHDNESFCRSDIVVSHSEIKRFILENIHKQQTYLVLLYSFLIRKLNEHVQTLTKKYDIIIYSKYTDLLLNYPTNKGIYYTSFFSFYKFEMTNYIDSIDIISDNSVRFNGGNVSSIYSLDSYLCKYLYSSLFNNQVYMYNKLYFDKSNKLDYVFFIPSVINVSSNELIHSNRRSIYTPEERLTQTIDQIYSIISCLKTKCKYKIYILEGSQLNLKQIEKLLVHTNVNIVLFSYDTKGYNYSQNNRNKSIYECYLMNKMLSVVNSSLYFKFGGRYKLLHTDYDIFNLIFNKDKPVFKVLNPEYTYSGKTVIETILYSIPITYREKYISIFENIIEEITTSNKSIEQALLEHVDVGKDYYTINYLNIMGNDAIEGFYNLY